MVNSHTTSICSVQMRLFSPSFPIFILITFINVLDAVPVVENPSGDTIITMLEEAVRRSEGALSLRMHGVIDNHWWACVASLMFWPCRIKDVTEGVPPTIEPTSVPTRETVFDSLTPTATPTSKCVRLRARTRVV